MIQGALIGLVVGLVMAFITWQKNKKRGGSVLAALNEPNGQAAALAALNRSTAPTIKLNAQSMVAQRERMAALTLIGDGDAIVRELGQHDGKIGIVAQVHSIGLLGARVRGVANATSQLNELATRMETEGGRLTGVVKKTVRSLADLAAAIDGAPLPAESGARVRHLAASDSPMSRIVVQAALAQMIEAAGGDATAQRKVIRQTTRAFDA